MKVLILEEALRISWDPPFVEGLLTLFFAWGSFASPISTTFFQMPWRFFRVGWFVVFLGDLKGDVDFFSF